MKLQEVLLQLDGDYLGHPYYISGHALHTALARRVAEPTARTLQVSTGVFVPGEHGAYPPSHSRSGGCTYMGTGLRPVEAYADLFVFRDGAQRWLSETRPRDAHNTHALRAYGGRAAYGPARSFGRPPDAHHSKRTVNWYVHCYLHTDGDDSHLPIADDSLDGLRLGGARNYGFGQTALVETRVIDLDELDYSRIASADAHQLELLSPYVLTSEYPGAESQQVPWWWGDRCGGGRVPDAAHTHEHDPDLRRRTTQLVTGDDVYTLDTIDHGQVVTYTGNNPVTTARNGVRRVGTHSKYGFGELRVRPADADRVPERAATTEGGIV